MDTVALVGRLLVSLAAVLVLLWLIGRRLRKGGRFKDTKLIDVLARQQLSRNSSLAVVRIGDQALVVGVTDAQVSVLGETDLGAAQAMLASDGQGTPSAGAATRRHRVATADRPKERPAAPAVPAELAELADTRRGALTGSALSPQTWKQTLESLRDLTSRSV